MRSTGVRQRSPRAARDEDGFESAWETAAGVQGWLTRRQALALWRAARAVPAGHWIVEVGSHRGRSTIVLGKGMAPGAGLLAVDPFDDPRWGGGPGACDAFLGNLRSAGLEDDVTVFRGLSREAAEAWSGAPLGLLFLDGAHDRASVLADIDGWERFLAQGGIVCFHDAFSSVGVTLALLQRHLVSRSFRCLGAAGSLVTLRREDLSAAAALLSTGRMLARLPYFARNLLVKAALRRGRLRVARMLGHHGEDFPY